MTTEEERIKLLLQRCYDALHSATYWAESALLKSGVELNNYKEFTAECKSIAREINEVLAEGK